MNNISLLSSIDESTSRIKMKIIPLVKESLRETNFIDYAFRKTVLSKLSGGGYFPNDENVILSITFDPKKCGRPIGDCCGDCNGCGYNPVKGLLEQYFEEGPFVITSRETVNTLLDVISLLANANRNALLREKCVGSIENDFKEREDVRHNDD